MNHHAAAIDELAFFTFANGAPRPRLLIVDDHASIRELHARIFKRHGYKVETAGDGAAGLEQLAEKEFDLVVTDRTMPVLDGVSMALALRSAGSRIPIVMVSRSLATAPLPPEVAGEFSALLPKPAHTAKIVSAVSRTLHRTLHLSLQTQKYENCHPSTDCSHRADPGGEAPDARPDHDGNVCRPGRATAERGVGAA